jgi:hypothetical protein
MASVMIYQMMVVFYVTFYSMAPGLATAQTARLPVAMSGPAAFRTLSITAKTN